jgi:hypothetical protein
MPGLYLLTALSLGMAYVVDKVLLLRYYKITEGFTKFLSQDVIYMMPLAILVHLAFGFIAFSNPDLLKST